MTTHNTHNRQASMPPVGFEPTISAGEWPQTHALDRAATRTGDNHELIDIFVQFYVDVLIIKMCFIVYSDDRSTIGQLARYMALR